VEYEVFGCAEHLSPGLPRNDQLTRDMIFTSKNNIPQEGVWENQDILDIKTQYFYNR
jgi:hypothetical protein